ncbi:carbonic anhydrase [Flavobacteriales bacterium]|nr:carbonic anhydrase [Flavobacteriales bacterium]
MQAKDAIQNLKAGNIRFVEGKVERNNQDSARIQSLTEGQAPWAIILSCADSRVVPELAFDTGLGELFVIRVAGNIANKSTVASIEYAIAHLGTKLIVVMGHESCGAVGAALANGGGSESLDYLLAEIKPAISQSRSTDINEVVKVNAQCSAKNLLTRSSIISDAVKNEGVEIVSAFYNLSNGKVDL